MPNLLNISGIKLKLALKEANLTQEIAANRLGVSRQTLNQWLKNAQLSEDTLHKIKRVLDIDLFPANDVKQHDITTIQNKHNIVTQNEKSIKLSVNNEPNLSFNDVQQFNQHASYTENSTYPRKSNTVPIGEINNPENESSYIDLGNGQYIMVVPIVPIKAQAGYIQNYNDEHYLAENFTQKHSFAVSRVYRGKYMAFIIDGDSMDDGTSAAIIEGSTVTRREIQKIHWANKFHIHRYKDYVIVHQDGIFTKRITVHDTDKGVITCNSLNPNKDRYPDFDLNLNDCLQIFNIVNVTQPR